MSSLTPGLSLRLPPLTGLKPVDFAAIVARDVHARNLRKKKIRNSSVDPALDSYENSSASESSGSDSESSQVSSTSGKKKPRVTRGRRSTRTTPQHSNNPSPNGIRDGSPRTNLDRLKALYEAQQLAFEMDEWGKTRDSSRLRRQFARETDLSQAEAEYLEAEIQRIQNQGTYTRIQNAKARKTVSDFTDLSNENALLKEQSENLKLKRRTKNRKRGVSASSVDSDDLGRLKNNNDFKLQRQTAQYLRSHAEKRDQLEQLRTENDLADETKRREFTMAFGDDVEQTRAMNTHIQLMAVEEEYGVQAQRAAVRKANPFGISS